MHWAVVPGAFDVMIGKSSADITLQGTLEVKADACEPLVVGADRSNTARH